jgi:HEAT repeats/Domain of unknown function (DUF4214)
MCRNRLVYAVALFVVAGLSGRALAQVQSELSPQDAGLIDTLQSDPDPGARLQAARGLGSRGSLRAIPALANAAAFDSERQVRICSGDAISAIRRRNAGEWIGRPPVGGQHHQRLVESWYQLYLHRPSDEAGMRDYLGRLRNGQGPMEVQAAMLGSDEYYRLHSARQRPWVVAMYADVLDRSPSARDVQNWLQALVRLGGSREKTAAEFLRSAQLELNQRQP